MYKLCVLTSIAPKLRPTRENLNAKTRNWFSDGYRTSVPGTSTCQVDTDCEAGEICQGGYCTGLRRSFDIHGTFKPDNYKDILTDNSSLASPQPTQSGFIYINLIDSADGRYDNTDYEYEYE